LLEAIDILKSVEGLSFVYFDQGDVVRHHLVQRIIQAYDEHKERQAQEQIPLLPDSKSTNGKTNGGEALAAETPPVSPPENRIAE
jgi:phosphate starvation-inducible PhoH-like protein